MRKMIAVCLLVGSLSAHHAVWSTFDSTRVVKRKGVITRFALLNPHSLIFVDSTESNGQVEHWALEVPNLVGLVPRNLSQGAIEFCGYATKDGVTAVASHQEPEPISLSLKNVPRPVVTGRLIFPELVVLASGQRIRWPTDERKCFTPEG